MVVTSEALKLPFSVIPLWANASSVKNLSEYPHHSYITTPWQTFLSLTVGLWKYSVFFDSFSDSCLRKRGTKCS